MKTNAESTLAETDAMGPFFRFLLLSLDICRENRLKMIQEARIAFQEAFPLQYAKPQTRSKASKRH
jgi:hypothetical protein